MTWLNPKLNLGEYWLTPMPRVTPAPRKTHHQDYRMLSMRTVRTPGKPYIHWHTMTQWRDSPSAYSIRIICCSFGAKIKHLKPHKLIDTGFKIFMLRYSPKSGLRTVAGHISIGPSPLYVFVPNWLLATSNSASDFPMILRYSNFPTSKGATKYKK